MRKMIGLGFLAAALLAVPTSAPAQFKSPGAEKDGLGKQEIGGKTLDMWLAEVRSPDASIRATAIQLLPAFGPSARKRAVPEILYALETPGLNLDVSPRVNACISLGLMCAPPDDPKENPPLDSKLIGRVVSRLTSLLQRDSQGIVRYQAAMALGRIGKEAKESLKYLSTQTIRDTGSWEIRKAAAFALGQIGAGDKDTPADPQALAGLAYALMRDDTAQVRIEALQSIIQVGFPGSPADAAELKKALEFRAKDKNPNIVIWSHMCLMRLDKQKIDETGLTQISKYLRNSDAQVRANAAQALGTVGQMSNPKVDELIDATQDEEPIVVVAAVWALGQIGPIADRKTAPVLEKLAGNKDPVIAFAAQQALDKVVPPPPKKKN